MGVKWKCIKEVMAKKSKAGWTIGHARVYKNLNSSARYGEG